jgi:4-oxalocrotonate tautomerase
MPLVDIQVIEGVFSKEQKAEMIEKVTNTMVDIEGEALRGVTWVRVQETMSGDWGIGGKGLTSADVHALAGNGS